MPTRTINHPGVEVVELPAQPIAPTIVGTNVLVMGYANKGTAYEVLNPSSVTDIQVNLGQPENEAERYMYYACKEVIDEGGNLYAIKLPYSNDMDNKYKYVSLNIESPSGITDYPTSSLVPSLTANAPSLTSYTDITISSVSEMTNTQYDTLVAGGTFSSGAEFVLVNDRKGKITGVNANEGVFVAFIDPFDAMLLQRVIYEDDNDVLNVVYDTSTVNKYSRPLTGTYNGVSVSEDLMGYFPAIEYNSNGDDVDLYRMGHLGVVVCKTVVDPNNDGKLDVIYVEAFVGSLDKTELDPATGQSVYLGDIINNQSEYIRLYRTTPSSNTTIASGSAYRIDAQQLSLLDFSAAESIKTIVGGTIVTNLNTAFEQVSNLDDYDIDIVLDAGLSTISEFATSGVYDPVNDTDSNKDIDDSTDVENWRTVCGALINFTSNVRKDCMCILDVPRNLAIRGDAKQLRKSKPDNTFSNTITPALKFLTGLNSSYAALYSDWIKIVDTFSGTPFWLPESVKAVGIYCRTDRLANIWDAPAGVNRGIMNSVVDIAFNPNGKEANQLYTKSFNYANRNSIDGYVLEGQKTTHSKPSAFDRVNVRRLFLRLERVAYKLARYYVYEPNNTFTRRRLVDTLTPVFDAVKSAGGLYNYEIVCDTRNNTPTTIDNNELHVTILLQPVKTAEFITLTFVSTPTGASFSEFI